MPLFAQRSCGLALPFDADGVEAFCTLISTNGRTLGWA